MKPEVAQRRIAAFRDRFGEAHYHFACHAAFPLALTPDLLYRVWANFQRDAQGESLEIPWMAVADVLLSSLCEAVGHELYEMPLPMRNALLSELKTNSRFGTARINELSDLLLMYVQQQIESSDSDDRDVAQAQRWTVAKNNLALPERIEKLKQGLAQSKILTNPKHAKKIESWLSAIESYIAKLEDE